MSWFVDAGIDVSDVSEDPYGFGQNHWLIGVTEVKSVKATPKGLYGMYVMFELLEEKYSSLKPFGVWIQLPPPKQVQDDFGYEFDPKNDLKHAKVVTNLVKFLSALGFGADEIQSGSANAETIVGKMFLGKMKASENDEGYDQFRWYQPKPVETEPRETPGGNDQFASNEDKLKAALQAEADGE